MNSRSGTHAELVRAFELQLGGAEGSRLVQYDEASRLIDARSQYFLRNGLGEDGGYSDAWVKIKLGKPPFAFPNLASRRRAVRVHDLHHLLTGYDTDWTGETEISAYEIGAGCGRYSAAWMLNLSAFFTGPFVKPGRLLAAFRRGRRCRSLYHENYDDALLQSRVGEVRERLGLDEPLDAKPTPADWASFAGWWLVSALVSLGSLGLGLLPFYLLVRLVL